MIGGRGAQAHFLCSAGGWLAYAFVVGLTGDAVGAQATLDAAGQDAREKLVVGFGDAAARAALGFEVVHLWLVS